MTWPLAETWPRMVFLDSGYDLTRLAWLLRVLPLEICGRLRTDRVMYLPAPPREPASPGRAVARPGTEPRSGSPTPPPGRDPAVTTRTGTATASNRGGLAPAAPEADAPTGLGTPRRRAPRRRGHPHPPGRGAAARAARPGPGLTAMVLLRRHHRRRGRPGLAGVPPPFRSRAHVPRWA